MSEYNKNGEEEEEEDDIISISIGKYGRWQLLLTFLLSLFNIPCTWHIFAPTFHAEDRAAWCARPSHLLDVDPGIWKNFTQPNGTCTTIDVSQIQTWSNRNITNWTLTECHEWEFSGEGKSLTK